MIQKPGADGEEVKQDKTKLSYKDGADQQPQENERGGDDTENHRRQFARPQRMPRDGNVQFEQDRNQPREQGDEQQQAVVQQREEEEENKMRPRDEKNQRQQDHGRRRQSSPRPPGVRLSQHPDCADDVHKYCKGSNLNNFAVVDCLQDDVEVSNVLSSTYHYYQRPHLAVIS